MDISTEFQETYNEFLIRKAYITRTPIMGTFELTPGCTMNCEMCYIRQSQQKIQEKGGLRSLEFWDRAIDQAVENGMLFCLLTGGEIFTYPYFQELYERLCHKGVHTVFNTNGTLLNEETVAWLAENPPRRLNISLYGSTEETYEKLCHYKGGLARVIRGFELLQKYGIDFRVHGVLVPDNVDDYDGMKEICNRFRVPMELSFYMFPPLRKEGDRKAKMRFTPEKMAEVGFRYRMDQCGGDTKQWHEFVEKKCEGMEHPENRKHYGINRITCRSGCSAFWINWKGEISGCGMEDDQQFSLDEMSFADAWKKITTYSAEAPLSEECAVCRYREFCPVCAPAACCETGSIDGTPEYLCEYSRITAWILNKWRI